MSTIKKSLLLCLLFSNMNHDLQAVEWSEKLGDIALAVIFLGCSCYIYNHFSNDYPIFEQDEKDTPVINAAKTEASKPAQKDTPQFQKPDLPTKEAEKIAGSLSSDPQQPIVIQLPVGPRRVPTVLVPAQKPVQTTLQNRQNQSWKSADMAIESNYI